MLRLLRVGLLHVGRVDDDERVAVDFPRAFRRDGVVQVALEALGRQHPAEPVLDLFRGGLLLERTDDGRQLHVLLRHDPVHHVTYETGRRLAGGEILPKNALSRHGGFVAIVASCTVLPLLVLALHFASWRIPAKEGNAYSPGCAKSAKGVARVW